MAWWSHFKKRSCLLEIISKYVQMKTCNFWDWLQNNHEGRVVWVEVKQGWRWTDPCHSSWMVIWEAAVAFCVCLHMYTFCIMLFKSYGFHMSLGPLYVLLGEVSVQILCPFFNWVVCLPGVESREFFIYLEIRLLSEVSLANMFSHTVGSLFILLLFSRF